MGAEAAHRSQHGLAVRAVEGCEGTAHGRPGPRAQIGCEHVLLPVPGAQRRDQFGAHLAAGPDHQSPFHAEMPYRFRGRLGLNSILLGRARPG